MALVLSTSPCGPEMAAITGVATAVSCTVVVAFAAVPCSACRSLVDGAVCSHNMLHAVTVQYPRKW